ncbi:hypothetical protein L210DRAFT_938815 [Boletus edulis BED1]|uniref:Uncharacterized protein n=1 Tax=Boletus edulis BED1 TaxID=1328754 RepID=A0AAD4G5F6_BOLED|nr:hypothetical protein L210DRAFT_938815 [Boletus edulis BED1]
MCPDLRSFPTDLCNVPQTGKEDVQGLGSRLMHAYIASHKISLLIVRARPAQTQRSSASRCH